MTSLRKTTISRVTILLTVLSLAAAMTAYLLVKVEVNKFLDAQLREIALNAGSGLQRDAEPQIEIEDEDQLVVQIWDNSGQLVSHSGPPVQIPEQRKPGYFDVTVGNDDWRVYRSSDTNRVVQISQRWSAREEVATHAATGAALPLVAAIPLAWLLIGWSINGVLRGLGNLSADIGRRSADAKDALSVSGVPVEIAPLVSAMDSLITRHQQALEAQRRFVSDAAHELRTPLAALQIQAENLQACDLADPVREIALELGDGTRRAAYLVNQLLSMARAESSGESESETVSLSALIRTVIADVVSVAEAKGVLLSVDIEDDIPIIVRVRDMKMLLSNLLDNAVRYTGFGGLISIRESADGSSVTIEIVDSGCGIPESAMPFIFDRFFRAAPPDIEGTGLGLAIAKATADRNGLQLSLRNRETVTGVIASVVFPLAKTVDGSPRKTA